VERAPRTKQGQRYIASRTNCIRRFTESDRECRNGRERLDAHQCKLAHRPLRLLLKQLDYRAESR
jgi:hypothetical protein